MQAFATYLYINTIDSNVPKMKLYIIVLCRIRQRLTNFLIEVVIEGYKNPFYDGVFPISYFEDSFVNNHSLQIFLYAICMFISVLEIFLFY